MPDCGGALEDRCLSPCKTCGVPEPARVPSPMPEWCGAALYFPVMSEDGHSIVAQSRRMCGLKEPHEWHQDRYDKNMRWQTRPPFVERAAALPTMRHSFTDPITWTNVTLVIPPGGVVFPAPGEPKIGVEHPGCPERGDLALQYDAWYCPRCRWSGRIVGAWAAEMIEAAPVTASRTDRQPPNPVAGAKGGKGTEPSAGPGHHERRATASDHP